MAIEHTIRTQSGGRRAVELTRATAIKFFCPECMYGRTNDCESKLCPLSHSDARPSAYGRGGQGRARDRINVLKRKEVKDEHYPQQFE